MVSVVEQELGLVDPKSVAYWQDTIGTVAALREQWPVVRSTAGDFEVLRYDDVERLLRDGRMHQALSAMLANQGITSGPLYDWWQLIPNNHDAPTHTRLRSIIGRAFTPKQVRAIRARIREVANDLIDQQGDGVVECDVVAGLCHRLPLIVLCEMLGVPADDIDRFETWTTAVNTAFTAVIPKEKRPWIEDCLVQFNAYVDELVDDRRANLNDDLLSALIEAQEAGDRLNAEELRALVINLLFAGHDTTKSLLGIGMWLLATHPDQLERVRADRTLVESAVEEIARYETPISGIPRIAAEDIVVADVTMPAGSYVTLSIPSANRDPRRFDNADVFDVAREDNRNLTFGFGVHHCIGAAIARAEVQETVAVVVERCLDIETVLHEPSWVPFVGTRRLDTLPLRMRVLPRAG